MRQLVSASLGVLPEEIPYLIQFVVMAAVVAAQNIVPMLHLQDLVDQLVDRLALYR